MANNQKLTVEGNSIQMQVYTNDLIAVDGANRTLPTYEEVGHIKVNKYVGVFYWLWHGYTRTDPIRDISKVLKENPTNPGWQFQDYYWGEPENGYYHAQDPWVMRRNLTMLANAGVDFIYLDFTNGTHGNEAFSLLCDTALDLRRQGINAPYIMFFVNSTQDYTVNYIYNNLYNVESYKSLWFYWQGKPLLMAGDGQGNVSQTIKDFFTWKNTWAFQAETQNQWRFIDDFPQKYSWETNPDVPEQICVNKSMGAPLVNKTATNNKGSSFHNGIAPQYNEFWECDQTPLGLYFQEQWDRAISVNPSVITVTGWNELTAGAWNMDVASAATYNFMGSPLEQDPGRWYFVDEFNMEFNRDIEPMKDGYTDNYYFQLVSNIRKYKGMNPPEKSSGMRTINIDGNFAEWAEVFPLFLDPQGDTLKRNFKNVDNSANYVNETGRNDIVESRVSCDSKFVYFYIKTADDITNYTDDNWMLLYINSDNDKATGWNGYDYVVNSSIVDSTNSVLNCWNDNQWNIASPSIKYNVSGNEMEIAVPRADIKQITSSVSLSFHIVDNVSYKCCFEDTFVNGDSAPDRRFDYRYVADVAFDLSEAGS